MINDKEIVVCSTCKTNFNASVTSSDLTPCKCGKISCKVTGEQIKVKGELKDFTRIEYINGFIQNG